MNYSDQELSKMMIETSLDKQDCLELYQMFFDDFSMQFQKIEEAIVRYDFVELQLICHRLKGASGSLRLKKIYSLLQELENAAKASNYNLSKTLLKRIDETVGV